MTGAARTSEQLSRSLTRYSSHLTLDGIFSLSKGKFYPLREEFSHVFFIQPISITYIIEQMSPIYVPQYCTYFMDNHYKSMYCTSMSVSVMYRLVALYRSLGRYSSGSAYVRITCQGLSGEEKNFHILFLPICPHDSRFIWGTGIEYYVISVEIFPRTLTKVWALTYKRELFPIKKALHPDIVLVHYYMIQNKHRVLTPTLSFKRSKGR